MPALFFSPGAHRFLLTKCRVLFLLCQILLIGNLRLFMVAELSAPRMREFRKDSFFFPAHPVFLINELHGRGRFCHRSPFIHDFPFSAFFLSSPDVVLQYFSLNYPLAVSCLPRHESLADGSFLQIFLWRVPRNQQSACSLPVEIALELNVTLFWDPGTFGSIIPHWESSRPPFVLRVFAHRSLPHRFRGYEPLPVYVESHRLSVAAYSLRHRKVQ